MRSAMNAIFYLLRTGCPWPYCHMGSFPPRSTVYNIFRAFQRELGGAARPHSGSVRSAREPIPNLAICASISVRPHPESSFEIEDDPENHSSLNMWGSSNVPATVQDSSPCHVAGLSNAPIRGSAETDVWPRTARTSLTPSWLSSHSPASSSRQATLAIVRLLSQALSKG
jgi:Putative transposase of IS4/5 family (DUF4096)